MAAKRKSYTTAFKLEVINYAEKNSNSKASTQYCIGRSTVQDWRKLKSKLGKYNKLYDNKNKCTLTCWTYIY